MARQTSADNSSRVAADGETERPRRYSYRGGATSYQYARLEVATSEQACRSISASEQLAIHTPSEEAWTSETDRHCAKARLGTDQELT